MDPVSHLRALQRRTLELAALVGPTERGRRRAAADERRRRSREEAIGRQEPASPTLLALAGWTILLANAPPKLLSLEEAWR